MSEKHPIADLLALPAPCDVAWDDMRGEGAVRFCGRCARDVHDLSVLTLAEARALLDAHAGKLCVNFLVDGEGNMLTRPDPVKRKLPIASRALSTLAAVAVASSGAALLGGCSKEAGLEASPAAATSAAPVQSVVASVPSPPPSAEPTATASPVTTAEPPVAAATASAQKTECTTAPHRTGGKPSARPPQGRTPVRLGGKPTDPGGV